MILFDCLFGGWFAFFVFLFSCLIESFTLSLSLSGYFGPDEPYGEVLPGALVVHGKIRCRLSSISEDGKWAKDERFSVNGKIIVRLKGQSSGKLMVGWRKLRQEKPEWFQKVHVYQQPSGYVDSVIQSWITEDLAEIVGPGIFQRDCFAASFTQSSRSAVF